MDYLKLHGPTGKEELKKNIGGNAMKFTGEPLVITEAL